MKKWTAAGSTLWIVGLAAYIIGLNLEGNVKDWMTIAGSIVFLAGLICQERYPFGFFCWKR